MKTSGEAINSEWRCGRSVGRTIYARAVPATDSHADTLIGMMDTPELAQRVVESHNSKLWKEQLESSQ